jgi:hypothetical protein
VGGRMMASENAPKSRPSVGILPDAVAFTSAVAASLLYSTFASAELLMNTTPSAETLVLYLTGQVLVFVCIGWTGYMVTDRAVNAVQQR